MSDTNISAPPAAAPSAPAPSQGVPVDPNPPAAPQPLSSQMPERPASSRREASRDSIRKAFERVSEPPKAAGSRMGHNQPPEPMQREVKDKTPPPPKASPLDLKKRPAEQEPPRSRGEHGHFAPASETAAARGQQAGTGRQPQGQPASPRVVQLPNGAPYAQPPRRWNNHAKAEWGAAPASVRGEVHRMHKEFAQAYQRMHGDHQEMNRIRHFSDLAKQHGTSLERALANYTGMESKLRSDPVGGLDVIVNNLNLRTSDGQRIGLRDIAWHVLNQSPDQHQSLQLQNSQTAMAQQLAQIQQHQRALAQQQARMQYQQRFAATRRGVDRFAETHPRLDELGDLIQQELRVGYNLPTAYRRAELLRPAHGRPATHAAQTRTTSAQTRTADRSIHGAPDSRSANGKGSRLKPSASPRDAVANAIRRVNGSL